MKRRMIMAVAAVLTAAVVVCGCGKKEENPQFTGEGTKEPEYQACLDAIFPAAYNNVYGLELKPGTYISLIGKETSTEYWKEFSRGAAQAAEDLNTALGYTGSDKIKVVYNGSAKKEDINDQVNILDEEIARNLDVLGIASVDEDACGVPLDMAVSNGIPIIAFDSGNVHQGILCTIKTDNVDAARTGAYKLADELGGEGQVILLVNDSESESARERTESFLNEMSQNHPDIEVVETIYLDRMEPYKKQIVEEKIQLSKAENAMQNPDGSGAENAMQNPDGSSDAMVGGETGIPEEVTEEQKAEMVRAMADEDVLLYYLEKYPDLKGMFGTSYMATQTGLSVLRRAERTENVSLMGFDAGAAQLSALESGEIDGLVVQNPFGMGYATVVAAARSVLELGNEAQVDTGYTWVTRENIEDESIQKMLY